MISNIFLTVFILSLIVTVLLIYISIYKGRKEKNVYYTFFLLHLFIYTVGSILEITSTNIEQLHAAIIVKYFGFPFSAPLLLLFIGEYIEKPIKNRKIKIALFIVPIISLILVYTNELTGLYYSKIQLITGTPVNHGRVEGTVYYACLFTYIYIIYFITLVKLLIAYYQGNKLIRKKIRFLILAILFSMLSGAFHLIGKSLYNVDITPIIMAIICVSIAYNIFIKNIHLSIPHSRYTALENMIDGYILIDESGMYLDANESALKIFPFLRMANINTDIRDYINFKSIDELINGSVDTVEFRIECENLIVRDYKITVSNLSKNRASKVKCWLIYDVTGVKALMTDLTYVANFDSLTGIYNRNKFFSIVNDLFKKHVEEQKSFAIIMIDIDLFKSVNDTYGHICGDKIIMEVAHRLKGSLRKSDILARYGGEEFVVFLQNITKRDAISVAIKFNEVISEKAFTFHDKVINITISEGVSIFDHEKDNNIDEVLIRADKFLYEAKSTGRNKVVIN